MIRSFSAPLSTFFSTFQNAFRAIAQSFDGPPGAVTLTVLCLAALTVGAVCPAANAQTKEWVWMGGSWGAPVPTAVYGTLGMPAAGNVPGARLEAVSWTDKNGKLWLFGGGGLDSTGHVAVFNDLWEFDPATEEWTWMGGSDTPNQPGVYGTLGTPAAGNIPGARSWAVSWTDKNGKLWLWGGGGFDSTGTDGGLNDLWEFDPSTGEWTWMAGSNIANQSAVYGTLGTPAAGNVPGTRTGATSSIDSSGNFWLFGGYGNDSLGAGGSLNDLWEFNSSTKEWAWMGGSNKINQPGAYGTLGTPAAENVPGARSQAISWTDKNGNFWLFGGYGYGPTTTTGALNDLWEFNSSTKEWTWIGGSNTMTCSSPRVTKRFVASPEFTAR